MQEQEKQTQETDMFKTTLIDVIETTLIKDNKFEDHAVRSLELIIEACLWRYADVHPDRPKMTIENAEDIVKNEWPELYSKYIKYKEYSNDRS